ncbi:hypothetical protein BOTBODRAFT_181936 [Botryobasidium botryosum FD-172 SS1]|uniref:Uncharacterized protein n=1 Tax=Botryobasidium botryosum (strain FD-172 SS1) TaxID=930990 RepID=A0A067LSN2_BOTB1|nr:hypothetical protein BOTBODRAFT_181936 [Botryobasidium botryosum FD-172 SS1]
MDVKIKSSSGWTRHKSSCPGYALTSEKTTDQGDRAASLPNEGTSQGPPSHTLGWKEANSKHLLMLKRVTEESDKRSARARLNCSKVLLWAIPIHDLLILSTSTPLLAKMMNQPLHHESIAYQGIMLIYCPLKSHLARISSTCQWGSFWLPKVVLTYRSLWRYREYLTTPSRVPHDNSGLDEFGPPPPIAPTNVQVPAGRTEQTIDREIKEAVWPFPNLTGFWFRREYTTGTETKSKGHMRALLAALTRPRTNHVTRWHLQITPLQARLPFDGAYRLPNDVQDVLKARLSRKACDEAVTRCKRELMHASWKLIIDDLFVENWRHGIVAEFPDGVRRRLYPRIFTYTADYPEKVLLATLRNNRACPCPRCLVDKSDIHRMGMPSDQRCRTLYQRRDNQARKTRVKKDRLKSTAPTKNAFLLKLSEFGFDYFDMLVGDFLHEWELGEWKTLFIHIMRILRACDPTLKLEATFNESFRHNVSEMKKFAARDFEDILQCMIPALEGLLPQPHDTNIRNLLIAATEVTLHDLEAALLKYGHLIRDFATETCPCFKTTKIPKEREAAARRKAKQVARAAANTSAAVGLAARADETASNSNTAGIQPPPNESSAPPQHPRSKEDSMTRLLVPNSMLFSTGSKILDHLSELEHRIMKRRYQQGSKTKKSDEEIAAIETVDYQLQRIEDKVQAVLSNAPPEPVPLKHQRRPRKKGDPSARYNIGTKTSTKFAVESFIQEHQDDPATKTFWEDLKDYFIAAVRGELHEGREYPNSERHALYIKDDTIHSHAGIQFNYTTYDVRRGQDSITLKSGRGCVMAVAADRAQDGPFLYARVLGVFHANLVSNTNGLPEVSYLPLTSTAAVGFISPNNDIRASHIIPRFSLGRNVVLDGWGRLKTASLVENSAGGWKSYYVSCAVGRDMFMRFHGGALGTLTFGLLAASASSHHRQQRLGMTATVAEHQGGKNMKVNQAAQGEDITDGNRVVNDDDVSSEYDTDADSSDGSYSPGSSGSNFTSGTGSKDSNSLADLGESAEEDERDYQDDVGYEDL